MSSSSFCVYCTRARSSATSFAVFLTMSSKRLFVASTNDWRQAWNVDCCFCSSFPNTSFLANAALTMVSTFVSCSSPTCETDRVGFTIVTVSASIQLWITVCQFTVRVSQTTVIPAHTCVATRLLPVDNRKDSVNVYRREQNFPRSTIH